MTDRELMQMALDALEDADQLLEDEGYSHALQQEAAKALRDRLEQPEPEPVANEQAVIDQFLSNSFPALVAITAPVHAIDIPQERVDETAKRKHEWVDLTKAEFQEAVDGLEDLEDCWIAIQAKLKGKNCD